MFEIPNAKRVRRDELYDSSSDAETNSQDGGAEDAELRARLNARLSGLLGLDLEIAAPEPAAGDKAEPDDAQGHGGSEEHEEKHEEEFEFRLFSTSSKAAAPARVVLAASDDEDGPQGEGAFLVPTRPATYYMAGEPTPEQRERYRSTAVTGEDIVAGAGKRAWGLEKPWRVVKITVSTGRAPKGSNSAVSATASGKDEDESAKKKRPGKKRRIAMRTKTKAEKAKRQAEEDKKMTKEEHLKEKKKRLNREKKLKRRAKEREQKLAAKAGGEAQEGASMKSAADSDTDESAE